MAEHQVRRLPVLNRNKRLTGIVSLAGIARCGDQGAELVAIEGVSEMSDEPRRMIIEVFRRGPRLPLGQLAAALTRRGGVS